MSTPNTSSRVPLQELVSLPAIAELAHLDQWVCWKYVKRKGKRDKPPFNALTGSLASHSNPDDWTSYEQARAALPCFDGLGFVFSEYGPYSGVDLDGCRNPDTGEIASWAWKIIRRLNSYTEISPSGTGVKIWVRGSLPESIKVQFGPHFGVEIYSKQRYFCITGQHLADTPNEIRDAQQVLMRLGAVLTRWTQRKRRPTKASQPATRTTPRVSLGEAGVGRLNARDTIDQANRDTDLGSLLESHGASLEYTKGSERHYSGLSGDKHDHAVTYQVSQAKDGNGHIGISYSPNGKLNKADFPRGFRWFDAYAALEHGGDTTAALKAITLQRPKRKPNYPPHAAEQAEYRTPQQVQDAARKRQKRLATTKQRQEWADVQTELLAADERACDTYRAAWAIHYVFFGSVGQHSVSVARMASALCNVEIAEAVHTRKMQRANEWLIEHGYLARTERYGDGRQHINIWKPANPDALSTSRPIEASQGHDVLELDHDLDLNTMHGACERAPFSPSAEAPAETLAAFNAYEPGYEFYESNFELDYEPEPCDVELPLALVEQYSAKDARGSQAPCVEVKQAPPWSESDDERHAPAAERASFDASLVTPRLGEYTGRIKSFITPDEVHEASSLLWTRHRELFPLPADADAPTGEQQRLDDEPVVLELPTPKKPTLMKYRQDVAGKREVWLANELRDLLDTLEHAVPRLEARQGKQAAKRWAKILREKIAIVRAAIDAFEVPGPAVEQPTEPAPGWKVTYSRTVQRWQGSRRFGDGEYDYEITRAYAQQADAIAETWKRSNENEAAAVLGNESPQTLNEACGTPNPGPARAYFVIE